MRSLWSRSLVLLSVLILFSSVSYAAQIVQNFSIAEEFSGWSYNFNVDQFDSNLGTLNFVQFELAGNVRGDATITNFGTTPEDITVSIESTLTLQRPDSSTIVQSVPLVKKDTTLAELAAAPANQQTWTNQTSTATPVSTLSSLPDLSLFTGLGSVLLPILSEATSGVAFDGSAALSNDFSTWASANLTVTYDYTSAVPEPATVLLLGSGFAGLVGWRRKQKADSMV